LTIYPQSSAFGLSNRDRRAADRGSFVAAQEADCSGNLLWRYSTAAIDRWHSPPQQGPPHRLRRWLTPPCPPTSATLPVRIPSSLHYTPV